MPACCCIQYSYKEREEKCWPSHLLSPSSVGCSHAWSQQTRLNSCKMKDQAGWHWKCYFTVLGSHHKRYTVMVISRLANQVILIVLSVWVSGPISSLLLLVAIAGVWEKSKLVPIWALTRFPNHGWKLFWDLVSDDSTQVSHVWSCPDK